MSLTPLHSPTEGCPSVQALQNEVNTGSVMTTAPSRNISTAATGVKSDMDSNSTYHITVNGAWNQTLQHADNSNIQQSQTSDARMPSSISPSGGPAPWTRDGSTLTPLSTCIEPPAAGTPLLLTDQQQQQQQQSADPNVCEPLQSPASTTLQGYSAHFNLAAARISDAYDDIISRSKRIRRSKQTRSRLGRDVKIQKDSYLTINQSLTEAVRNIRSTSESPEHSTLESCHQVCEAIVGLWAQLNQVITGFDKFGRKNEAHDRSTAPEMISKRDLEEGLEALEIKLDNFKKFVGLVRDDSTPDQTPQPTSEEARKAEMKNLEKLSIEGQVSALLCKCLCRACSKKCHDLHIAYFSLEPENADVAGVVNARWRCHMAFESNATKKSSLIWLRAVSSLEGAIYRRSVNERRSIGRHAPDQKLSGETHPLPPSHAESASATASATATATMNNPKKRRAASTPPEPARKILKSRPGPAAAARRVSEPSPTPFEVCPEVLGQYDMPDLLVMNMVDDLGSDHDLFCLPKDERPIPEERGGEPVKLRKILDSSRRRYKSMPKRWVLQLSRLIAEAVLRFDLKDTDTNPMESVVFYKSSKNDYLTPFLEVKIRKSALGSDAAEHREEDDDDDDDEDGGSHSSRKRSDLLLNLGQILLQLGLIGHERQEKLRGFPQDAKSRASFIREKASDTGTSMGDAYSSVIKSCVKLSAEWERHGYFEEELKERYYRSIVKPLRSMEEALLSR